jgi:hypothetical protein
LSAAEAKWKAAEAERLSEMRRQAEEEMERRLAAMPSVGEVQNGEDLAAARETWEGEQKEQQAAAQEEWRAEHEQRLAEARRGWEMERTDVAAEATAQSQREMDRVLAEAKEAWDQEGEIKLARVRGAWESELTQRMGEAQEEWETKEEQLNAITRRALERAKLAEQNASLSKRLTKDDDPDGRARKGSPKAKRKAKSGTGIFRLEHPGRVLALACVTLAVLVYANLKPSFSLPRAEESLNSIHEAPAEEHAEEQVEEQAIRLFIQPSVVNVRREASQSSPILTRLTRKQPVVELQRQSGWVQITLPDGSGQQGWIHGSLLAAEPVDPQQP